MFETYMWYSWIFPFFVGIGILLLMLALFIFASAISEWFGFIILVILVAVGCRFLGKGILHSYLGY
jgi:hypothetical protein